MNHQAVFPSNRPRPALPYSPGIRFGNLLFTAGAVGADTAGNVPGDIREQTRNALDNLRTILEAAGTTLAHVLKATVYLTDMKEFAAVNEVYKAAFPADPPARTTVGVAALARPEMRIEIELVAAIP